MRRIFFNLIFLGGLVSGILGLGFSRSASAQVCPDFVASEATDYCPALVGTRCATYGVMPSCGLAAAEVILAPNTSLNCGSCTFSCTAGRADCNAAIGPGSNGCEVAIASGPCRTAADEDGSWSGPDCARVCTATPRFVSRLYSFPAAGEAGFIRVVGDIGSGGDLYLNSGRAIRIDGDVATSLNVGNYSDAAGAGDNFGLRLHAPDAALSELLLDQGGVDRWAVSLRTPSRNLEFWRNNGGWGAAPVLALDFGSGRVGIGTAAPAFPLDVVGDVRFTGTLQGGLVPWARLTSFPAACPAGQYVTAVGGAPTCGTPAGGVTGSGTVNTVAMFTGTGSSVGNSLISQAGTAVAINGTLTVGSGGPVLTGSSTRLSVGGNLGATGCFGPVYQGPSATARDGSRGGYLNANTECNTAFAGSRVCKTADILESIACGAFAGRDTNGGTSMWINNLAPSLPTPTNDCGGWQTAVATSVGVVYTYSAIGGTGGTASCDQALRFACCM